MEISGFRGTVQRAEVRRLWDVRLLPRPVAWFYVRAVRTAVRLDDRQTLALAPSARELASLFEIARDCEQVVELGASSAWAAIALALDDERRHVTSFYPVVPPERDSYLGLVRLSVRARIDLRQEPVERAPKEIGREFGLVLVDSPRDAKHATASFAAARRVVRPGGLVVIRNYRRPGYEAATAAFDKLGLKGTADTGLLVWRESVGRRGPRRASLRPLRAGARMFALGLVGVAVGAAGGATFSQLDSSDQKDSTSSQLRESGTKAGGTAPRNRRVRRSHAGTTTGRRSLRAGKARAGRGSLPSRRRAAGTRGQRGLGKGGARLVQTFSGRGSKRLGTIRVRRPSVLSWRTDGPVFSIASRPLRANFYSRRGHTELDPGPYRDFEVGAAGDWTMRIEPR